ncbi:hypothetical protein [Pseudonocardia sp. NPDC049635]|uniref:hypothetical protein n=1 Tax=Pseudonocardia sp. NPDC049635 TaxID=3155506 RepID=UPI00340ED0A4
MPNERWLEVVSSIQVTGPDASLYARLDDFLRGGCWEEIETWCGPEAGFYHQEAWHTMIRMDFWCTGPECGRFHESAGYGDVVRWERPVLHSIPS